MSKKFSGVTLIEFLIVISLIAILFTIALLTIRPEFFYDKTNDTTRISDLGKIVLAIEEYKIKNKQYPGEVGVIYKSTDKEKLLAVNASNGWIPADLSPFISKLPIDPINSSEYIYRYLKNDNFFEVDAQLKNLTDKNENDDGNNNSRFEMGTDLSLLN
ncbi:prepilin-type N-terminal cleavage/methylation domain-containing protein [Patescibacteria group bacterium]|nr:prepilin-type N-terminal cleavage/methylation domain-containing protein [Patescibacteria group bacterium]